MGAIVGGLTRQQVEFFESAPWVGWVKETENGKHPYIPGAVIEALLRIGAGQGGWSLDVVESAYRFMSPVTKKNREGKVVEQYGVLGTAKVRITIHARNAEGYIIPGVEAFHVEGCDSHEMTCNEASRVGPIVGNAIKSAITEAIRNAASRIGPVFGQVLMRGRDKKANPNWRDLCRKAKPTYPEFPFVGEFVDPSPGFSADAVMQRAMEQGGDDHYETDDDGEQYDAATGVVASPQPAAARQPAQQPAPQTQQRQAQPPAQQKVEPAPVTATAPAPAAVREPSAPPAARVASGRPEPIIPQRESAHGKPGFDFRVRPDWMSVEDAESIKSGLVYYGPEGEAGGKPWAICFTDGAGTHHRQFTLKPSDTVPVMIQRLRMPDEAQATIVVRLRTAEDVATDATSIVGWPEPKAEPAHPPRTEMLAELRRIHRSDAALLNSALVACGLVNASGHPEVAQLTNAPAEKLADVLYTVRGK